MDRFLRIVVMITILVALSWYGKSHDPSVTLSMCLQSPGRYDGQLIGVGTEVTVVQTWPDSFRIQQMGNLVTVHGEPELAAPGDFIRLLAVFHAPNRLELQQLYVAKGRRDKILWSLLPLAFLAFFWLRAYRFDFRRMYWQER